MQVIEIVKKSNRFSWVCVLFIDDIADISSVESVDGLPKNVALAPGSLVYDSSLTVAVLNSSSEWVITNE